ncbi:2', 3'-cyclic nucleotide 2'-phosphodiesterase [Geobacillus sp. T6]|uniref:bifunctional 2',3'-cyclic-nucleotide 2'-phosphodiesterase/3'-nucleotidase n=1 Tax=Geobacillus sp. T6 TaxID=1659191 RepID=UPI00064B6ECB|nr:bifunctional 2',3'-cyclic-nucleotide 2'-phosphodiesterase/3'-nucleotidase [Geobacillus sp. T6]KLR74447.1 2', 3'-cyclic nucleotide 2'-phosphodiesterase [Geobacillus sp. T6]
MKKRKKYAAASVVLALGLLAPAVLPTAAGAEDRDVVKLRILETTDVHMNLVNYDYFKDSPTNEFGLSKTARLIEQARAEQPNTLLFDNGDLIQGTPLGDYVAKVKPLQDGEVHPAVKLLHLLKYDAATVGNHEFNYGLDFLNEVYDDAKLPIVNANVYRDDHDQNPDNDVNYFTPYQILAKEVVDEDGEKHTLKIGVIGFVPPQIMDWDKANLQGKVIAKDIVQSAQKYIPKMKAEGADLIVVLSHSGIETGGNSPNMENASYYLTQIPGVDAVLTGHQHKKFPALPGTTPDFPDGNGINNETGTINGVPVTMPGAWGDTLGVIDLTVEQIDGKWKVTQAKAQLRPVYDKATKTPLVDSDPAVEQAIQAEHEATIQYVRSPVGKTTSPINSYFALIKDDPSVQIVTNAQKWYVEKMLKGTKYEGLPVLSAGAPFKAGGRGGASYYTDIPAGEIAIKNVADLYLYPNTVYALKITGAELKEWLEWSAGQFNQIDPNKTDVQPLVNNDFPTYNFDIIDGVMYEIDVTEPAKYDKNQNVINPNANRIKNLKFEGKPVTPNMEFIVATNNYRATTNRIINPGGKKTILAAPDENRQVIIDYIRENGTINPSADGNWRFAPVKGKAPVTVTFESSPEAQKYLPQDGSIRYVAALPSGFAQYEFALPLWKEEKPNPPKQPEKPTTPPSQVKKVYWDGVELKKGQIGRLTVQKPINLWKRAKDGRLVFVRILQPGEVYRVYGYDARFGGQYAVGGGYYVTDIDTHIRYETPSKEKLKLVNGQ